MRVLVEPTINSFGESLLAYSAVPVVKKRYPYASIALGCGVMETGIFTFAKGVDSVVLNSTLGGKANWTQYERIITGRFGIDDQNDLQEVAGDLDSPSHWGHDLGFTFTQEYKDFFQQRYGKYIDKTKKIVGIYYSIPSPAEGDQHELLHLHPQKFDLIIKRLNMLRSDVQYIFFAGVSERGSLKIKGDNVIVFGPMDDINMLMLFDRLDVLVGVASSYTSVFSYFSNVDRVILSSIKSDDTYLYRGVPDACFNPHRRVTYQAAGATQYIYPESYANGVTVGTEVDGKKNEFIARSLSGIDEAEVAKYIHRFLELDYEENIADMTHPNYCELCQLHKEQKCLYRWKL